MGRKLGEKIKRDYGELDIDVVIPIPETSCDIALEIASVLDLPYRRGFVKTVILVVPLLCRDRLSDVNQYAES